MFHKTIFVASLLAGTATFSQAGTDFSHPALNGATTPATTAQPVVLVGHPASPRWQIVHANGQHPAVLQAGHAATIDPNVFIVQPPASTHWTVAPLAGETVAALR